MAAQNLPALLLAILFYIIILAAGIWASSWRTRMEEQQKKIDPMTITLLAGRNINLLVGIFTLTATWVGGGFILGIAETVYNPHAGLVWALVPVAYIITFLLGGLFFVKPMRENKYITMMDPFQKKYGNVLSTLLLFPTLVADVLWVARTLVSIGGTMAVILGIDMVYSNILSAAVAISYTLMGGFFSVAYTDVIQLILIFVSLWITVPFLVANPNVESIATTAVKAVFQAPWVGKVEPSAAGKWLDEFLLLALGGLAYQAFYQRILSASSYRGAQWTCFVSSGFCVILGIPPMLVGAVAASTDWSKTDYNPSDPTITPWMNKQAGAILPIAMNYLTPQIISGFGLGAVAAAAMSSMDSALLSAASLFSSNIYRNIIRKEASDREIQWVIRISVIVTGIFGTGLTFLDNSVMIFWHFGVDMSYTIMFPQLVCILFFDVSNSYGSLVGLLTGLSLRILSGEPLIGLKPVIRFPGLREEDRDGTNRFIQYFPFRTTIVLISIVSILSVSWLASVVFSSPNSESWDVFKIAQKQAKVDAERKAMKERKLAEKATPDTSKVV